MYDNESSPFKTERPLICLFVFFAALIFSGQGHAASGNGIPAPDGQNIFFIERWSPYLCGMGIGILSWLAFVLSDHPIGVSSAYAQTAGMIEKSITDKNVDEMPYYKEHVPKISWTWIMVTGLLLGAFVSALLSGDFRIEWVPALWESRFGHSPVIRLATAFTGGILLGIGARWADGCTSGHGISGTLQLVVSSWIAVICFFVTGIIMAHLIY